MSIQSWVAIAVTLVTVWALIKRYETRLVLLAAGLFLCCISLDPMYGLDAMGKSMTNKSLIMAICGSMGFAFVASYTQCDRSLVHYLASPIRGLGIFLLPVCTTITFFINIAIPSAAGCAAAVGSTLIPVMLRAGINPAAAAAAVLGGTIGSYLSPGTSHNVFVANMAKMSEMDFIAYHSTFSLMCGAILIVGIALVAFILGDHKGDKNAQVDESKLQKMDFVPSPLKAIVPFVPIAIRVLGNTCLPAIKMGVAQAMLIGAIAGTWMISGVVPTMIYYGLQILHPSFFLVASCAICAVVSLMTGSSWTTIATIGVALMGIGQAMGFSEGWVAGAIISGAYFGDKLSLLSDTTVLASSTAGVEVFTHIRYMLYTTVPSMLIPLGVFTVAGLALDHGVSTHAEMYAATLAATFRITPWLLAVPLATGMLIARKLPAIVTLFSSVVFACAAMLLAQPELVARVAGVGELDFMSGFKGVLMTCFGPTAIPTGAPQLDELVATRGMAGMLNTVWLIICAMCFGGVMTGSGMLRSLTSIFLRWVRRAFSAVASTVGAGLFFNLCTADQYISIILSGRLFRDLYADRGLEPRLLSRSVEDSATVCSVLIPWNSCGMTQATVLGVSTFVYAPYCIFNIVSPLMSLLVAAVGWNIKRKK